MFSLLCLYWLVLAVQNAVQLRQLAVQGGFAQLLVLHRQNQHPGQVHQRADVKHVHVGFAAVGKAQIAHGKCGQRHDHRHKSSCGRYFHLPGRAGAAVLHKKHRGKKPPYTAANSSSESGSAPPRCGHSTQCSCHSTLAASSAKIKARAHT